MQYLLPLILVCMLAAGGTGLVMLQKAVSGGGESGGGMGGGALALILNDITGNTTIETQGNLGPFVPDAPEGWERRLFTMADGETITGEEFLENPVAKSTTNSILKAYGVALNDPEGSAAYVYAQGERLIALRMRLVDRYNRNSLQGGLMASISMQLENQDFNSYSRRTLAQGLFAKLDGIEIIQQPRYSSQSGVSLNKPVDYRYFKAKVGRLIEISVLTNAADADVAAILSQLDMAGLNAMLPEPAPEFRGGVGWIVASEYPLSTVPPTRSLAGLAWDVLNNGQIYAPAESEALTALVKGRATTWADIDKRTLPTENLIALLGPEPESRLAKRIAKAMSEDETLSDKMRSLTRSIASDRISSQAEIYTSRDFRGMTITPEFRALMGMLPVGRVDTAELAEASTTSRRRETVTEEDTGPVIRRGVTVTNGDAIEYCTIELGVRRCVVTDELEN